MFVDEASQVRNLSQITANWDFWIRVFRLVLRLSDMSKTEGIRISKQHIRRFWKNGNTRRAPTLTDLTRMATGVLYRRSDEVRAHLESHVTCAVVGWPRSCSRIRSLERRLALK